jgi:transcriptional regulator with XRE-family HTH domain
VNATAYRLEDPTQLGSTLARLRKDRGLTRRALAEQVAAGTGLPQNTVASQLYRWENGLVHGPDLRGIAPVLNALGYDLALVPRI